MTRPEFAIECVQLVKLYRQAGLEALALQGLDLTVRRGEMLGLVGASGSGKSTLLNILGGLDRPTAGRAWVAGEDLHRLAGTRLDRFRRGRVGFVWQQSARNLLPQLTAQENVELPLLLAGRLGPASRGRVGELLAAVGLAARRQHRPHQLSGGEQQRLGIAVALANQPDVLLADEPTGELDSEAARSVFAVFKALNRLYDQTILVVSHDPGLAGHMQRVIALRDGRTASETVRTAASGAQPEAFEERVVVDAAGRLQLPKEYVERYRLHPRARLTATNDGLLLQAVSETIAAPQPAPPQMERKRHWWQGRRRDEDREDTA